MAFAIEPFGLGAADARDQELVDEIANHEQERSGDDGRNIGAYIVAEQSLHAERDKQVIGGIHAEHHEVALREVDDAHHTEDERKADAHQSVDGANQAAGHQGLQNILGDDRKIHRLASQSGGAVSYTHLTLPTNRE